MIVAKNRVKFIESLDRLVNDDCNLSEFCKALTKAGKSVLDDEDSENPGWYDSSKEMLRPFFNIRNKLLFEARNSNAHNDLLKMRCRDARKNVRNANQIAKTL